MKSSFASMLEVSKVPNPPKKQSARRSKTKRKKKTKVTYKRSITGLQRMLEQHEAIWHDDDWCEDC